VCNPDEPEPNQRPRGRHNEICDLFKQNLTLTLLTPSKSECYKSVKGISKKPILLKIQVTSFRNFFWFFFREHKIGSFSSASSLRFISIAEDERIGNWMILQILMLDGARLQLIQEHYNLFFWITKCFFDPEKHRIEKTWIPASRNRSSSEIAGINPYDCKSVDYSLFIIDNKLSMFLR